MNISPEKINKYKEKLQAEKESLEKDLAALGRKTGEGDDWMATPGEQPGPTGNDDPDKNVQADYVEEFEERVAESSVIEEQYAAVTAALKRIDEGTYGICKVSGEPIEEDRLDANPAADTNKEHMNDK